MMLIVQDGWCPLHYAAHLGHMDMVEDLVEHYDADATLENNVSCV